MTTSIASIWDSLGRVQTLTFVARTSARTGWNGRGEGSVVVTSLSPEVMTFTESGDWQPDEGGPGHFRNVYRWTRIAVGCLRLEHLRFGDAHPVSLFDLVPGDDGEWVSDSPHVCREDCYTARMSVHSDGIALDWRIRGPKKDETIRYQYRFTE
jgi:hypothetical protein